MKPAFVINFTILSYILATDIYTPSLPIISLEFMTDSDAVQASVSVFLFGAVLACILGGLFSEYIGNKKLLLSGLILAAGGIFLCILSPNLETLIIGRFLQGFGSAAAPVIGFSLIQEIYSDEDLVKIYAWIGIVLAGSPAIAPALGGYISTHLGWRYTFWFVMALLITGAISCWKVIPSNLDAPPKRSLKDLFKSYVTILTNRQYLSYALLSPAFNGGEWFAITFLPFYFQRQLGLSAQTYGWSIGFLLIWFSAGSFISSKILNKLEIDKAIHLALGLGLLSTVGLFGVCAFAADSLFGYMFFLSTYMTAFGMLFPTSVKKVMGVFKDMKTRSSAIRFMMITAFAFFGSYAAEYSDDTFIWNLPLFLLLTCILAYSAFMLRNVVNRKYLVSLA